MKNKLNITFKPSILLLVGIVAILSFVPPTYSLVGKWSIMNLDGTPAGEFVNFNKDNTYTVVLPNGAIGENGFYSLKDSIFSIKNVKDVCGHDYWGKYNLTFYGSDSVHFALIEDSCTERRMDLVGYNPGLKRSK
jgi:hypothetical protein